MKNEKTNLKPDNEIPQKKEFNPIWVLIGMGILIGLILAAEIFGLKK